MADQQSSSQFHETMAKSAELARETREARVTFLKTEVITGLTFAQTSLEADAGSEKRTRNQANARKAYDTILKWLARLSDEGSMGIDAKELEPELTELKQALRELGEAT